MRTKTAAAAAALLAIGSHSALADAASAQAAIRAEPKVRDMLYQPGQAVEWQIGVITDGSPRYGYAEYICQLLREHGVVADRTAVRIVDIVKVSNGSNFREASLGRVNCTTFAREMP